MSNDVVHEPIAGTNLVAVDQDTHLKIHDPRSLFVVRLWDGMDGLWMDVTKPLTYEEAMEKWNEFTKDGTEARSYSDIDYYKVFPADTVMHFDGSTPNRTMR